MDEKNKRQNAALEEENTAPTHRAAPYGDEMLSWKLKYRIQSKENGIQPWQRQGPWTQLKRLNLPGP